MDLIKIFMPTRLEIRNLDLWNSFESFGEMIFYQVINNNVHL